MLPKFCCFFLLMLAGVKAEQIGNFTDTGIGGRSSIFSSRQQDFSFVFSLQRKESGTWTHLCSATVLDEYNLLTAAHCLYDGKCLNTEEEYCAQIVADNLRVVAGRKSASAHQVKDSYELKSYVIHPSFYTTESAEGDVALLRVKDDLELSRLEVRPVRLGTGRGQNLSKGQATLVRWGNPVGQSQPTLRTAEVSLVPHDKCKVQYNTGGSYNYHPDKMGCMRSSSGLRSCNFNAGGPVMVSGLQLGIWFLPKNASCSSYRKTYMYVSIPTYFNWIKRNRNRM